MSTSKIQTGLRVDETMYEKLKTLSKSEGRSLNNLVEYILQKHITNYEKENGVIPLDSSLEV